MVGKLTVRVFSRLQWWFGGDSRLLVRVVIWGKQQKSGKEQIEESELERKQEESEEKTSPGSTQG